MKLSEWLKKEENQGKTVQIGCEDGTGLVLCGKVSNELIKRAIELPEGKEGKGRTTKFWDREIVFVEPAIYSDYRINIEGKEKGDEVLSKDLEKKCDRSLVSDQIYIDFAKILCGDLVKELSDEYVKEVMCPDKKTRIDSHNNIGQLEKKVRSQNFSLACDGADGQRVIDAVRKKRDSEIALHLIEKYQNGTVEDIQRLDKRMIDFIESIDEKILKIAAIGNGRVLSIIHDADQGAIDDAKRKHIENMRKEMEKRRSKKAKKDDTGEAETVHVPDL